MKILLAFMFSNIGCFGLPVLFRHIKCEKLNITDDALSIKGGK